MSIGIVNVTTNARRWMEDEEITSHELNDLLDNWTSQTATTVNGEDAQIWSDGKCSAVVVLGRTKKGVPKTTVISVRRMDPAHI